jgi:hypothetical protein
MAVFGRTAPVRARRKSREVLIVAARGWQLLGLGAILALGGGAAQAENLDAGKPAPALFAATCAACHSSPRGLAKDRGSGSLASFLQEHYTSGPQSAASLAAYLIANPGTPARGKQQPAGRATAAPAEGAGKQGEAKTERQPHPPQTATMRPDSMIEPVEPRRPGTDATKGKGKRQQTKQEAPAPAAGGAEPPAAAPAAPAVAPAAPVAAAPPPDQSAFSAPSP